MGVSEVSDAVVIVVSEQTGIISVALDGKLRRSLDYVSLKRFLGAVLLGAGGRAKTKKKKKNDATAQEAVEASDLGEGRNV